MKDTIEGEVRVRLENVGGGRRIYLGFSDLPGWLLGFIRDAGPFEVASSTYGIGQTGPDHVNLVSTKALLVGEPPTFPPDLTGSSDTSSLSGGGSDG